MKLSTEELKWFFRSHTSEQQTSDQNPHLVWTKWDSSFMLSKLGLLNLQAWLRYVQFSSVAQSCPTLCDPMECITPGLPVHHQLPEFTQTHVHRVSDAIQPSHHLTLTLLLPPSIFPSIRVFSNELFLHIRSPKYYNFSFSISPSNEYSGLISFRTDRFDLLAAKGLSRVFSNTTVQKHKLFGA